MSKSVTNQFIETLVKEVSFFSSTNSVKSNIGDSIWNHRVPSVRQFIRYLQTTGFGGNLDNQLESVYTLLRSKGLFKKVRRNVNRTDAYDVSELHKVLTRYVLRDPSLKGQVSKTINQVV